MLKSQVRAVEYRAKAEAASVLAGACVLQQVRERHEAAAARWTRLAESEDYRTLTLHRAERARQPPA